MAKSQRPVVMDKLSSSEYGPLRAQKHVYERHIPHINLMSHK